MFDSDNFGSVWSSFSRTKGLDHITDGESTHGAEASSAASPLLQRTIVTHAHMSASVQDAVDRLLVAHGALAHRHRRGRRRRGQVEQGVGILGGVNPHPGGGGSGHPGRPREIDGGRAEDADARCVPVDIPERPQGLCDVYMHEHGGDAVVPHELDRPVGGDGEAELVADRGAVGHVLADHPVLGPVDQEIGVLGQGVQVHRSGVDVGQAESQGPDVGLLG